MQKTRNAAVYSERIKKYNGVRTVGILFFDETGKLDMECARGGWRRESFHCTSSLPICYGTG